MASQSWKTKTVSECLVPVSVTGKVKIQTRDYKPTGRFPIIDQGQDPIAGWTDDESAIIDAPLPLIVFGDHTRVFKFVEHPFARGADGTQLLRPTTGIDPLFFFYACRSIDLEGRGYNRHFSILKEREVSYPEDENAQRSLGRVLRHTELSLKQQDSAIESALPLKNAAMRELFTRGLRGETQKDTDIGAMPQSWNPTNIDAVAKRTQYGLSQRGQSHGATPILRMNCQLNGKAVFRDLQFVDLDEPTLADFKLEPGDILFNRTNSIEHVGRTAIFETEEAAVFASYLVRLSVDKDRCDPRFLNHYMNWPHVQSEIKKLASRAVGQANINASKLRTVIFPLPPTLEEQAEIVDVIDAIDRKIDLHKRKRAVLEDLFRTLLHKLMIGEIDVNAQDLSALPATNA